MLLYEKESKCVHTENKQASLEMEWEDSRVIKDILMTIILNNVSVVLYLLLKASTRLFSRSISSPFSFLHTFYNFNLCVRIENFGKLWTLH